MRRGSITCCGIVGSPLSAYPRVPRFSEFNYGEHFGLVKKRIFFGDELKWKATDARVAVEIGSREGSSTLWFLDNLLKAEASRLYCIDPWEEDPKYFENFNANIREHPHGNKVRILRSRSQCDFVYIDGSHTAHDVLWDLMLSFRILRVGGAMMCDDYTWPMEQGRYLDTPKAAIDAFTTIYAEKFRWIRASALFQIALKKTAD
jgi:predicted O-methyltransferase YrrM